MRRRNPIPSYEMLDSGTKVIIRGLKTQPYLNGFTGTVHEYEDSKGRYSVRLDGTDSKISLRPECVIEAIEGVRLKGLQSQPHLNGKIGSIIGWQEERQRFTVQLDSGKILALKSTNLVWPSSTTVKIDGLKNAVQYNGKWGKVDSFDGSKYSVRLGRSGEQIVRMNPSHVQVACVC